MGYIDDLRKNDVTWRDGGMAIAFWTIVGVAVGGAVTAASLPIGLDHTSIWLGSSVAGSVGLAIGMFAALGRSTLAKVLAFPGVILMAWW